MLFTSTSKLFKGSGHGGRSRSSRPLPAVWRKAQRNYTLMRPPPVIRTNRSSSHRRGFRKGSSRTRDEAITSSDRIGYNGAGPNMGSNASPQRVRRRNVTSPNLISNSLRTQRCHRTKYKKSSNSECNANKHSSNSSSSNGRANQRNIRNWSSSSVNNHSEGRYHKLSPIFRV
jgi:hypothetical protein